MIRNIQDLPWKPYGKVLDPFAGLKRWWVGVDTSGVTFGDLHPQTDEVLQADAAALPFPDAAFDEVWADPPHLIRNDVKHWTKGYARFGNYRNRAELERLWPVWSAEFARVVHYAGILVLKTLDGGDYRVVKASDLALFETCWRQVDVVKSKTSPGWSRTITLYTRWVRR